MNKDKNIKSTCINCSRTFNRVYNSNYGFLTSRFCGYCRNEFLKKHPNEDISIYNYFKIKDNGEKNE